MPDSFDLLVVGAGVVGLSVAWRAAQRGLTVCVVERERPGVGASTAAAGLLGPAEPREWSGPLGAATRAALDAWEDFALELEQAADGPVGLRREGALHIALDTAETAALEETATALAEAGVAFERLDGDACAHAEPGLRGVEAGLLVPGEAHVDTARLLARLARACTRAGVQIDIGVEPLSAIRGGDGPVEGVRLSDGTERLAPLTVLACGAWSSQATWLPAEARPPVRPLVGEYLLVQGDPERPPVTRTVRGRHGSTAPREDGSVWVGTTVRDAGYVRLPSVAAIHEILTHWTGVLPALAELSVASVGCGLRPASPDGLPYVGASAIDGLAIATGHGRGGIIHAPLAGEAIAALAAGDGLPDVVAPFDPRRAPAGDPGPGAPDR